ncbi:unnamed protein product [Durusdinium trenchii]|uniref:Uncharacterized protein n=1 Tax=Durusdinium trenchii TaxID=1381693 RepID=A0ABP0LE97_9DINO
MSWKKSGQYGRQDQQWKDTQWGWPKGSKQDQPKKSKDENGMIIYGYDGKKVDLKQFTGGQSSSGSSQSQAEQTLREENARLKTAVRQALASKPVEDLMELEKMSQLSPREELRERQKLLNQERKSLNRAAKIKEDIEKKERKFASWRTGMRGGLEEEERRHASIMAEMRTELQEAEKAKDENMDEEPEERQQSEDPRIDALTVELEEMKSQFSQMITYTARMEKQNQNLADQVQALVTAMSGQPAKRSGGLPDEEERQPKHGRSRSPKKSPAKSFLAEDDAPMEEEEIKQILQKVSENAQMIILNMRNAEPEKYKSAKAMKQLIGDVLKEEKAAQRAALAAKPAGEVIDMASNALVPFGKALKGRDKTKGPYGDLPLKEEGGNPFLQLSPVTNSKKPGGTILAPAEVTHGMD